MVHLGLLYVTNGAALRLGLNVCRAGTHKLYALVFSGLPPSLAHEVDTAATRFLCSFGSDLAAPAGSSLQRFSSVL